MATLILKEAPMKSDKTEKTIKWYDILTKTFYVKEPGAYKTKTFVSFSEFYKYLHGHIYSDSCFFGYSFSEKEIKKYKLKIGRLNFKSLIKETIDIWADGKEALSKSEKCIAQSADIDDYWQYFSNFGPIKTYSDLENVLSKLDHFDYRFDLKRVFFSYLLDQRKDEAKDALIDYACHHKLWDGFSFPEVLINYGREAATKVICNYNIEGAKSTINKWVRIFKQFLDLYDAGKFVSAERESGFDPNTRLYYVCDRYVTDVYPFIGKQYFPSFDAYISFVNGLLINADLRQAPLDKSELSKYTTDETTLFPFSKNYKRVETLKEFDGEHFLVKRKWFDENDNEAFEKIRTFDKFFDFVYFLKGDLSGADLLLCEGMENIVSVKDMLNLGGVKTRSEIAEKLGTPMHLIESGTLKSLCFAETEKNELETVDVLKLVHCIDQDTDFNSRFFGHFVAYISDIHLTQKVRADEKNAFKTAEDIQYYYKVTGKKLASESCSVNLIGGDTVSSLPEFEYFVKSLSSFSDSLSKYFFVLGNHEIFYSGISDGMEARIEKYRDIVKSVTSKNVFLVQNNLFYLDKDWHEISESELARFSSDDIKKAVYKARLIIFGGIGFAWKNKEFNANDFVNGLATDGNEEIRRSTSFSDLYEKIIRGTKGRNLIVLTHLPLKYWAGDDARHIDGVIYVSGHTHKNYFFDDGRKRIYADNQIGYKGKLIKFKRFAVDFQYDIFSDYKDGIFEISKDDYCEFYRGINEPLTLRRDFEKLFMIKRDGNYMFFAKTLKDQLRILSGGMIYVPSHNDLNYYFEKLGNYSLSIKRFMASYTELQKKVSSEISRFGGSGFIHGSIVDIDFYNHVYVNPLDGTITPYYATSMSEKYVYKNVSSLLCDRCPNLYKRFKHIANENEKRNTLMLLSRDSAVSRHCVLNESTKMYAASRIMKGLQYVLKHNIVRIWNDELVNGVGIENGRRIISGMVEYEKEENAETNNSVSSEERCRTKATCLVLTKNY